MGSCEVGDRYLFLFSPRKNVAIFREYPHNIYHSPNKFLAALSAHIMYTEASQRSPWNLGYLVGRMPTRKRNLTFT